MMLIQLTLAILVKFKGSFVPKIALIYSSFELPFCVDLFEYVRARVCVCVCEASERFALKSKSLSKCKLMKPNGVYYG